MATRGGPKQARQAAKTTLKAPGKEQVKIDKQPASVLEIVPGKFNETDWLSLLENDDTEDYIADIFESIWIETTKQIQQIYIRKQLLPFTLMMTENALSNVIQWAFLERDNPNPASGYFWDEDLEPVPCIMDSWGEGVVPACREEHAQSSVEQSPLSMAERPVTAPVHKRMPNNMSRHQRPSTGSSTSSTTHTIPPNMPIKDNKVDNSDTIFTVIRREQSIELSSDDNNLDTEKFYPNEHNMSRSSFGKKQYCHDVLVINTKPPQLEPLSNLFIPPRIDTNSSYFERTPTTFPKNVRAKIAPKASSELGSDVVGSTTNITTTTTRSFKRQKESRTIDDKQIEDAILKAPTATHSLLKSILSRPPGYRELEIDDNGNVITMSKLDPEKFATKSIRVKCDIIKARKSIIEVHPPPVRPPQKRKLTQHATKTSTAKLILPEQPTEVGDLIQPVPGVLYEDARLKKGDPRRYQTNLAKYTHYYDDIRPLRPIAQRTDLAILKATNDLISQMRDDAKDDADDQDLQIPKLHRLPRIPPILSEQSPTSA